MDTPGAPPARGAAPPARVVRAYDHARDRERVREICAKVFGGEDRVPGLLGTLSASAADFPVVLAEGGRVVAFANIFRLPCARPLFHLEAVRVAEGQRGRGAGAAVAAGAVAHARSLSDARARVVSTTVARNTAMVRIFARMRFLLRGACHLWPSYAAVGPLREAPAPLAAAAMLAQLGVAPPARTSRRWECVQGARAAEAALREVAAPAGTQLFPLFFTVATAAYMAQLFADPAHADRSVWALKLHGSTRAVACVALGGDGSHVMNDFISATVADVAAAEDVVAFAAQFPGLKAFRVGFDMGLREEDIAASPVLGPVGSAPFLVLESPPDTDMDAETEG